MPLVRTVWRTSTASNQPQRRGRPVTTPNSRPRSPSVLPISFELLGRERARADPRGVGLADAEHVADRARAQPGAGRGLRRHGVRRGDVGIGAVVDVEQRALRALEQDALALAALVVEQRPHRIHVAAAPSARPRRGGRRPSAARSRSCRARGAARCDAPAAGRSCRRASAGRRDPSGGSRAGRPCPRRPGRCRGRWCRSRPCRTPSRARRRAPGAAAGSACTFSAMRRLSGVTVTPCPFSRSISSSSAADRAPRRCR